MKSKTLSTIANLLSSLQKRITKTSAVAHQNTGSILILTDKQKEVEAAVEVFRAQSFQRTEKIAASLAAVVEQLGPRAAGLIYPEGGLEKRHATLTTFVAGLRDDVVAEKKVNDDRETRQTLRDQNNVQSLVNLKDSTQKAFDQVKTDVKNLMVSDERTNLRLSGLEYFRNDLVERAKKVVTRNFNPTPAAPMPSDHVWVNKKLTGVYDSLEEVEAREQAAEIRLVLLTKNLVDFADRLQKLESMSPVGSIGAESEAPIVNMNRRKIISAEGFCTDTACKQQQFAKHYFGPGCRFYETSSW